MAFQVLDCTLRDGGYVNDWQFGKSNIKSIVSTLIEAQINYIELGFVKGQNQNLDRAEFSFFSVVDKYEIHGPGLAVMVESGYPFDYDNVPYAKNTCIEMVRIITWKSSINSAYAIAENLLKKGYKVCINFTRTDQYSINEFVKLSEFFTDLNITAIYIVDTFGSMHLEDFSKYSNALDDTLRKQVSIGIHAHNNLAQANSIAQYYCCLNTDRNYIIDATLSGIGRGAGNVNLEILLGYLNKYQNHDYDDEILLKLSDRIIDPIIRKFGSQLISAYVYAANKNINPEYVIKYQTKSPIIENLSGILVSDRIIFK